MVDVKKTFKMYRIDSIRFTEKARFVVAMILSTVNWALIVTSLSITGIGIYIKVAIEEFTNLVDGYDSNTLPLMLIGTGAVSALVNCVGGFICFAASDPQKRSRYKKYLIGFLFFTLCMAACDIAAGVFCFLHIKHIGKSFHVSTQFE